MTNKLPYPFDVHFLMQNKVFMLFCPPDRLDEEKRPVLEGRSLLYMLDKSAYQACPYTDSRGRSDKPINIESLKSFLRHQDSVNQFIIGSAHFLEKQRGQVVLPDLSHLYALAYIGYRAPSLYFCRKLFDDAVEIPSICSVVSRFFQGLINMLAVIAQEYKGTLSGVTMTAEQLYTYADDRGQLIGREACAASRATIIRYLALCLDSLADSSGPVDSPLLPFDLIGQISHMTLTLEFSSLVYEMVRCRWWRKHVGVDVDVTQRFATPQCLLALKLTQFKQPFEHVFFHRAVNQMQAFGPIEKSVLKLLGLARDSIDISTDNIATLKAKHDRMKVAMHSIFDRYTEFMNKHVNGGSYLSSNLDVFFGKWPI